MFKQCCALLNERELTISFFESASAGYLAYQFSLSPFSGQILIGSLVCYDLKVKENVLDISSSLIQKYTAESMQVTEEMIHKGQHFFKSDIYLACTGLLKEGGSETKEKPVGTFFYSISYLDKIHNFRSIYSGSPEQKLSRLVEDIYMNLIKIVKKKDTTF